MSNKLDSIIDCFYYMAQSNRGHNNAETTKDRKKIEVNEFCYSKQFI